MLAPSALKKMKRSAPARRAASTSRQVAIPESSSIEPCGWSRIAAGEMDDDVDAAQRVAEGGGVGEVAERDLDADPILAEPSRVADEAADRPLGGEQPPRSALPTSPLAPVSSSMLRSLPG